MSDSLTANKKKIYHSITKNRKFAQIFAIYHFMKFRNINYKNFEIRHTCNFRKKKFFYKFRNPSDFFGIHSNFLFGWL